MRSARPRSSGAPLSRSRSRRARRGARARARRRCRAGGRRARSRARPAAGPRRCASSRHASGTPPRGAGSVARSETRPCMTRPISVEPRISTAALTKATSSSRVSPRSGVATTCLDHVDQDGERELVLAAPAPVDRRLRDARAGGHPSTVSSRTPPSASSSRVASRIARFARKLRDALSAAFTVSRSGVRSVIVT